MDIAKDSRQFSCLEVVDTGRRRRWRTEEKVRLVQASYTGVRQASAVARQAGISRTLMFGWRKAYREGRLGGVGDFVPVLVSDLSGPVAAAPTPAQGTPYGASPLDLSGRMEIVLCGGARRLIVGVDVEGKALRLVLEVLEGR